MFSWRITKYNPQYRNASGFYLKNDWTSFSDMGKIFDEEELTFKKYLIIGNYYIETIILFMN